ncbi:hypothetical protein ANMWB30_23590 [Arthrobacter sp. MWB30]|nr:hypothetical protein ANMWB30_23590 [Arthrobacter sp. MWB30]
MNDIFLNSTLIGPDGIVWTDSPGSRVKVVSTNPPAGAHATHVDVVVDVTQAGARAAEAQAAAATALANRYTIHCGYDYSHPFKSYREVWPSPDFGKSAECSVQIDGQFTSSSEHKVTLLPSEQAIVDVVVSSGGSAYNPAATFADVMRLCATVPKNFPDTIIGLSGASKKPLIQGALALCPDAPHAALLQESLAVVKYDSGQSYTVGKDMEPGTYATGTAIKACYWSRTTGGGDIIANNFIDFAPNGLTVTVYPGEGFTAQNCGVWTKAG